MGQHQWVEHINQWWALRGILRGRSREGECAWISCQAVGSRCQEGDIRGRGCASCESVNVSVAAEPGPCALCLTSPCESCWTVPYVISWTSLCVICWTSLCEVCWTVYSQCWSGDGGASGWYAIFFSEHGRQPWLYRHNTSWFYDNSSNSMVFMRGVIENTVNLTWGNLVNKPELFHHIYLNVSMETPK